MSHENAELDTFTDPFELEEGTDTLGAQEGASGEGPSPEDLIFGKANAVYEERPIPAITAMVFYETEDNRSAIELVAGDRRMSRVSVDMHQGGVEAATEYMRTSPTPNLLIVESLAPAEQLLSEVDALAEHCEEGVEVMVVGKTNDIQLYRGLMTRGVSEYLVPPVRPQQVIQSISDLFADPDQPFLGRTISVVGAKGGAGSSTIAHNLAWSLAQNARINTTLVDLDLSFGTTALDFNDDNAKTVLDALTDPDRTDDAVLGRLLSRTTERLSLFTAPATMSPSHDIPSEAYDIVIEGVRRNVPFVVLDLPHMWTDWVERTLVSSSEILVVCQPDLASLRNGKNLMDRLSGGRSEDEKPRLVLNMVGMPKRPEIPVKDFAAAMDVEPEIILPFDPQLFGTASNNGQMLSETDPESKPSLAIDHLASALTGRNVEARSKSLIQKLLGK